MKTTLIAVLFLFAFTALNFAQETASTFTATVQPITIAQNNPFRVKLLDKYVEVVVNIYDNSSIDEKAKDEILKWKADIQIWDKSGVLRFPQGTITIDKNFNTWVCLSKNFNKWAGHKTNFLDFINPFSSNPKNEIEITTNF